MATQKIYRIYSVIERPKQDDFWLNIGTAFPHREGDGFNLVLQALPLHGNGRLVMRAYEPKEVIEVKATEEAEG
jgi:hypothetical protein